jgi:hypothetical protein
MPSWNRGHIVGQKPPLKPREVWSIRTRLQVSGAERDLALFNLAIDSKLRGCDLVTITVGDVVLSGTARDRAVIIQKKTGRPVQFEITEQTRAAVGAWIARRSLAETDFLFPSRVRARPHMSTRQYGRIVDKWFPVSVSTQAIWNTLDETDQGITNLQEDGQHPRRPAATRSHDAGEHRPLPRDRGR